ncbi:MAG: hypothetical protein AB7P01_15535 [Bacteroidia bacterium]
MTVRGKFTARNGNNESCTITISKNDVAIKTIPVLNSAFEFQLGLTQYFILTFSKPGYIAKKYFIDTHSPEKTANKNFAPVAFDVELQPESKGAGTFIQPGGFRYMEEIEGFGYDPIYVVPDAEQMKEENKSSQKQAAEQPQKTAPTEKETEQQATEKEKKTANKSKTTEEEKLNRNKPSKSETESETRKSYYTDLPDSRTEETSNDNKKTTTTITIIKSNIKTVYTKVVHAWGGVFFFMNGESITEAEYSQRTK